MRAALLAEHRKTYTTRMWWILLITMAGYLGFIGVAVAFSMVAPDSATGGASGLPVLGGEAAAMLVYSLINSVGYVFPLVIGTLAITTEYRHQTVTESLLVQPNRSVWLGAKLIVTVPLGLIYGVVGTLALVAASAPLLEWQGDGAFLTDGDVIEVLVFGVVVTALWAVLGVAFGSVVPNQIAAIVVILAFTQLVEPVARLALGAFDTTAEVAKFLPGAAADAVIGASLFGEMGAGDTLSRGAGALVLLGYVAGFALLGRLTTLRRDIG